MERPDHLTSWNGTTIESDGSQAGWGAEYQWAHKGGPWSREEDAPYQLPGASSCIPCKKSFLKHESNKRVLLRLDNQTAVAYVNDLSGKVSAQAIVIAKDLTGETFWCLSARRAQRSSRFRVESNANWILNKQAFQKILVRFPTLYTDLFSSRLTFQLPWFFSWSM